jgi:ribose transport system ATP-binding protein
VKQNLTLSSLERLCRKSWIDRREENRIADDRIQAFSIRTQDRNQMVSLLSGGNQQKVVIARALLQDPDILIMDEPTRGIDIGAKEEIHGIIRNLARAGKALIVISSELPEIMSLSTRLLVMSGGMITAELDPRQTTQEEIMKYALGGREQRRPDEPDGE